MFRISNSPASSEIGGNERDAAIETMIINKPGDILLNCRPFVHIIDQSQKGRLCDLCLKKPKNRSLKCCKDCGEIFFCDSCLATINVPSVFKTLHMLECPLLTKYSDVLSSTSKFFLRLLLRLKNPESIPHVSYKHPKTKEDIYFENLQPLIVFNTKTSEVDELCEQIKCFYENYPLKSDEDSPPYFDIGDISDLTAEENAIFNFLLMLEEFRKCDDLAIFSSNDLYIFELWSIFIRLWSYMVPIYDELATNLFAPIPIGYGLYLEASMLIDSHSCQPNCSIVHYGPLLQLRSIKDINFGDSITINYVPIGLPKRRRQLELKKYFIAECKCKLCVASLDFVDYDEFNKLQKEFRLNFLEDLCDGHSAHNKSFFDLGLSMAPSVEEARHQMKACTELVKLANELQPYYVDIYGQFHPERSRFLFAHCIAGMNLLLFQLQLRNEIDEVERDFDLDNNNADDKRNSNIRFSNGSDFGGSTRALDRLSNSIQDWSMLFKETLKAVRNTHGFDHPLFNAFSIPLAASWRSSFRSRLTLSTLNDEPQMLLKILASNEHFLKTQMTHFIGHFEKFFGKKKLRKRMPEDEGDESWLDKCVRCSLLVLIIFSFVFAFMVPLYFYYHHYVDV